MKNAVSTLNPGGDDMKTTQFAIMIILTVFALSITTLPAYANMLDGKSFSGMTGKMGKKGSQKDEIRFENGQFQSVDCKKYGFGSGPYVTRTEGDKTHFVADTYSADTGRIAWVGTISGNSLDATYLWYKKGKNTKPKQIKWFKGTANQ